jgi:hypothetical protein
MSRTSSNRIASIGASTAPASTADTRAKGVSEYGYLEDDDEFVLPPDTSHLGSEAFEERVQTTQNRLSQLRAEAETLEREKQQFEELSRKQKDFMVGRTEVTEKLSRALALLDRETYETQKRVEQLLVIKDGFNHHLDVVESLNPEQWNHQSLGHELTRAIGLIDDARADYQKSMPKVQASPSGSAPEAAEASAVPVDGALRVSAGLPVEISREAFGRWAFCGAAFTLPLAVVGLLYIFASILAR